MPNTLRMDPTRTTLLRRQFIADMVRRFKRVAVDIVQAVVEADAFGLAVGSPQFALNVDRHVWAFQTNPEKIRSFRTWLKTRIDANILTTTGPTNKPWLAKYIESAYNKGVLRSFTEVRKAELSKPAGFVQGTKEEFLRSSFGRPIDLQKVELLYTRAFTELEGVTATMDQQLSRILADGLTTGDGPRTIARTMAKQIAKITNTRAKAIARTEIIRAHAEGQLDSFEKLGIKELNAKAEWSTAGDDLVCAICADLEASVYTVEEARGLIPEHINCRCMWIPANVGEKTKV